MPCPALSLQVCVEKWNLLNPARLHLPRPSTVALEVHRLNALDLGKRIGKSVLGKVSVMPFQNPLCTNLALTSTHDCLL